MASKATLKKTFSENIIALVEADPFDKSYMSHIIEYCEREDIPVQKMRYYINRDLKERLRIEAVALNMVQPEEIGGDDND